MADLINERDPLNVGRLKLNEGIKASERAEEKSETAVSIASRAKSSADSTQAQLNNIVVEGDSSVEAAQARVNTEGIEHTTLKERIDSDYTELATTFQTNQSILDNSREVLFSKLDFQQLLAQTVTTIHSGAGSRFPQAAIIDTESSKYYVTRQTTGEYNDQMLYEYDLSSGVLLRSKDIPTTVGVYIEGLVYFRKENGDVCFIIPTQKYGHFGIFNFESGLLEFSFQMEGSFKIGVDNNRKYFLASRHSNYESLSTSMNGILIYDLDSVISGMPRLVRTVEFYHGDLYTPKIQGITMIDDLIYLGRGVQTSMVTIIDTSGNTLYTVTHDKTQTLELINGNPSPGNAQQIESEGISWVKEGNATYPVVFIASQGKASLIKLGDTGTRKLQRTLMQEGTNPAFQLSQHPALNIVSTIGNAYLRVEPTDDLYARILSLPSNGLYTLFASGSAANTPISSASIRGVIQVDRFINGSPDILSIIVQDFRGTVWANYYDASASPQWKGWSHIGGAMVQISGSTFNPLSDAVGPGEYETQSGMGAPTNTGTFGTIRHYTVTVGAGSRKKVVCVNNDANGSDTFINTRKTDGAWTGWKRYTMTSV